MSLLNLLDPNYTKEEQEKEYINNLKVKSGHDICDNPEFGDNESKFKYLYNGVPMEIIFINYVHDYKKIVPIPAKYAIELSRKQTTPYFFFKFDDGLYIWKYNPKEMMIEYRYNEKDQHSKFIYLFNDKLTELKNVL